MKKIGLGPLADRIATEALAAARGKKGPAETRRRLAAAVLPLLGEAVEIGLDQALIVAREHPYAVLAIEKVKRELQEQSC